MANGLGLGDAYSATLGRIKGQGGEKTRLGMAALMWVSHSERPLKADELCFALAVEIGSPNLNPENIPSISTILACCQGLVVVGKEASTARLIHFTLQEYLRAHPELFGPAHSIMAETCLSYLNSQQVKAFSTSRSPSFQDTPFLEYSSLYWGVHAKRDLSDCAKQLALKLFDDFGNHIPTRILLLAQRDYIHSFFDKISLFSDLHYASFFGIIEIVSSLIEMESCDINKLDCGGNTPLAWASRNGHEGVVSMLLGRDNINPDKPDIDGRTPLLGAARNGHEGVVKMLLEPDGVSPGKADNDGRTPLCRAARNGHEGVVKALLGRDDANPDKPDNHGRIPLWWAAHSGYEGVVKILLRLNDIDPDKPDNSGRTPLWIAAHWGHEGVVKMLLERDDINPGEPDNLGRTPLWWAARRGHEGVVKILLARDDVSPDKPDRYGQTPLFWAVENEHKGVIALLQPPGSAAPSLP